MAELARDEEAWWQAEVARLAPQLLLPGRPVRGGGRAAAGGFAVDAVRFAEQAPALQRRLLRFAAAQLGANVDFAGTEALRHLTLTGRAGQKVVLAQGLRGERTHRELQLSAGTSSTAAADRPAFVARTAGVPGELIAPELGLRLRIVVTESQPGPDSGAATAFPSADSAPSGAPQATLRPWKAGDRVRLRHSSGLRKVKEVLERLHVSGSARGDWPVLELDGRILWMQGVDVEPEPGIRVEIAPPAGADSSQVT
jgi:tRNA(Ile)-lysidine synthase